MFFLKTLLSTTLSLTLTLPALCSILPNPGPTPSPIPLVIWHGLGDNYAAAGLARIASLATSIHPGTHVHIIRLASTPSSDRTATFLGNLTTHLSTVCAALASDPILAAAPAINALGFSQGGAFLRAYVQRCNAPRVRSLVTFGSPHNGIARFQACAPNDLLCNGAMALLSANTWSSFVQGRLVPAQYYRDPEDLGQYLAHSNFLADVNNERQVKNATYKENVAALERLVMYEFEEDETVVPRETSWFGERNLTTGEVTPLRERRLYGEDWLGLRRLDEKGGLVFRRVPGRHMQLDEDVLRDAFERYFGPERRREEDYGILYKQHV